MSEELKPCLRCGSDRVTVMNIRDGQQAICKDCKSSGPPIFHGPGRAEDPLDTWKRAVAAWNQRAKPVVKALEFDKYGEAKAGGAKYCIYEAGSQGLWNCVCYPHEDVQYRIAEGVGREEAIMLANEDQTRRALDCLEGYDD